MGIPRSNPSNNRFKIHIKNDGNRISIDIDKDGYKNGKDYELHYIDDDPAMATLVKGSRFGIQDYSSDTGGNPWVKIDNVIIYDGLVVSERPWQDKTFYVAVSGDDSAPGTDAKPFRTIQKAIDSSLPGDTIILRRGDYDNMVFSPLKVYSDKDNYLTVRSEVPQGARIKESLKLSGSYLIIDGMLFINKSLTIKGDYNIIQNNVFDGATGSLSLSSTATGDMIKNNVFKNKGSGSEFVIMNTGGETSKIIIEGNTWLDSVGDAIRMFGTGHVFRGNTVRGLTQAGSAHADIFQVYDNNDEPSNDMLIENNLFIDSSGSIGMIQNRNPHLDISNWTFRNNLYINVGGVAQISTPYFKFYNNVFINSGQNTAGPILLRNIAGTQIGYEWPHDTIIKNNVFIGCSSYPDSSSIGWYHWADGINSKTPGINFAADNNYVTTSKEDGFKPKSGFEGLEVHGITGGDPGFSDIGNDDLHLTKDSPLVDKGISIAGFNKDKDDNIRPYGPAWDIGAYEYTGTLPRDYCGDGTCNGEESCSSCVLDCGTCNIECIDEADLEPCDGTVSMAELSQYIDGWKHDLHTIEKVMKAIIAWKR